MNSLLIDTNVFIYHLDKSSRFHENALSLLNSNYNLFTSSKNISEFFSVTTKLNVPYNSILNYYFKIKSNTTILFPNEKSLSKFEDLFRKYQPRGNHVYDIEIISLMLANQIEKVATFNQKDFENIDEVKILNQL